MHSWRQSGSTVIKWDIALIAKCLGWKRSKCVCACVLGHTLDSLQTALFLAFLSAFVGCEDILASSYRDFQFRIGVKIITSTILSWVIWPGHIWVVAMKTWLNSSVSVLLWYFTYDRLIASGQINHISILETKGVNVFIVGLRRGGIKSKQSEDGKRCEDFNGLWTCNPKQEEQNQYNSLMSFLTYTTHPKEFVPEHPNHFSNATECGMWW